MIAGEQLQQLVKLRQPMMAQINSASPRNGQKGQ
jgi:hypothetical protein